jgi:hypothetical protein
MPEFTPFDREDLRATVARVLEVDVEEVTDTASFVDDLGADSLIGLEVIVVLEKRYGVKLTESALRNITCLDDAYRQLDADLRTARP